MSFEAIDPIIKKWSIKNKLKLFTMDRDWEVRSFKIDHSIKHGRNFKIWIDMPDSLGKVVVHILNLDSPKKKDELNATIKNLEMVLDKALNIALGE